MSKVILTADIHLGVVGRLNDIIFSCRVMREYAHSNGIDTAIVLGDLFHDRQTLDISMLNSASRFFEETSKQYDQQWIVFPGNHDLFLKHSWDVTSLVPMRKHLTVIEDIKAIKLDEQRFIILPFITYEKSYMKVLRKIADTVYEPGDKLLTHIGVCGAALNTCFLLKDWSIVKFDDLPFDRIYTGHFHSAQQIGNVYYPGSPIPFKFDEGDVPHGFYVYDTETNEHEFIDIWEAAKKHIPDETPPPQFCTILDEQIPILTEADINNNMIRIGLQREYSDNEKKQIQNQLKEMGARVVRWLDINKKEQEAQQKASSIQTQNLFQEWTKNDTKGTKDLDTALLKTLHDEVAQEGDEEYALNQIQ